MAETEFVERMLSMLPEEFQDIYDDTIPKAKEMRKKMGDKVNTFPRLYVNGMRQYSASNRKYVSPKL